MYAVEFQSTIHDDGIIKIPSQYKDKIGKNVKVIILSDEQRKTDELPRFSALAVNTKDYKFDREYANER